MKKFFDNLGFKIMVGVFALTSGAFAGGGELGDGSDVFAGGSKDVAGMMGFFVTLLHMVLALAPIAVMIWAWTKATGNINKKRQMQGGGEDEDVSLKMIVASWGMPIIVTIGVVLLVGYAGKMLTGADTFTQAFTNIYQGVFDLSAIKK